MIAGLLGFSEGTIPFNYLGCPVFKGKPKCIYFQAITDKIKVKMATWKGVMLSIMGRVQLVKSIIHSMLVYSFHIYMWPRKLLQRIDSWIKNFIWSGDILTRKVCTVSWKRMCHPWAAGGLDLKSTHLINESLMLQLAWQFTSGNSQWSQLLRQRYLSHGHPIQRYIKSSVWCGIKEHMGMVVSNSLWIVGTGDNIQFWSDNWLGEPLLDLLKVASYLHENFAGTVADVIMNGRWNIPQDLLDVPEVASRTGLVTLLRRQVNRKACSFFHPAGCCHSSLGGYIMVALHPPFAFFHLLALNAQQNAYRRKSSSSRMYYCFGLLLMHVA